VEGKQGEESLLFKKNTIIPIPECAEENAVTEGGDKRSSEAGGEDTKKAPIDLTSPKIKLLLEGEEKPSGFAFHLQQTPYEEEEVEDTAKLDEIE